MTWHTLGSLALPFQLTRQAATLRADLARHSAELATGRVAAPQRHLRGNLAPLAALEARQSRIAATSAALRQDGLRFDAAQLAIGRMAEIGGQFGAQVSLAATTGTMQALSTSAQMAAGALADSIAALSVRVAGQAVLGGSASDRPPLAPAQTLLDTARAAVHGLTSAADISAALDAMFHSPGGAFDTIVNQAGPAVPGVALPDGSAGLTVPTVADTALRAHLKNLTQAALLGDAMPDLPLSERTRLSQQSAEGMSTNAARLAALQAVTGHAQARIEDARTRLRNEEDALARARDDMIGADPFEAAARLEDSRSRLEAVYAVTARLSRLSLLDSLR